VSLNIEKIGTKNMPLLFGNKQIRANEPCILIIFGATGDLTSRKIIPALYNLYCEKLLPTPFACLGFARRDKTDEDFRLDMKTALTNFSRRNSLSRCCWENFKNLLHYHKGEFHEDSNYQTLKQRLDAIDATLGTRGNRIYYLATPPSFFPLICKKLYQADLIYDANTVKDKWSRIVIEKPFGRDLKSAFQLQADLLLYLSEDQIYRIDHYLGKETVQNILTFRFTNFLFESLWNNRHIDHIQITVAEDMGIGSRGKFWEEAGLLRDIIQNHMMQLVSLIAMEPPVHLSSSAIHDEKVKVLQAILPLNPKEVIRGQYINGFISGENVVGYREEKDVSPTSSIETYVALKININNWRWAGVPFYLRSGKRLPKRTTEIAIIFKDPPQALFSTKEQKDAPNTLTIRIQPDEGACLKINCKVPGPSSSIQAVKMDFKYDTFFEGTHPEAYERLLCDSMLGDSTLFIREDEVFQSWKLLTPVLDNWAQTNLEKIPTYPAGSQGPQEADYMIQQTGHKWRVL
jgi:glucose-6-phosphate 1-dehydrogenase